MELDSGARPSTSESSKRVSTHGPRNSRRDEWRRSKGLPPKKSIGMNKQGGIAAKRRAGRSHRRRWRIVQCLISLRFPHALSLLYNGFFTLHDLGNCFIVMRHIALSSRLGEFKLCREFNNVWSVPSGIVLHGAHVRIRLNTESDRYSTNLLIGDSHVHNTL